MLVDNPVWGDDRENVLKAASEIVVQRLQVLAIHLYVSVRSLTFLFHFDEVLKLAQLTHCKSPLEQKELRHERRNNGLRLNEVQIFCQQLLIHFIKHEVKVSQVSDIGFSNPKVLS
ncbi:hypothetical protein M513_09853 [Trichuris suis]|uniref:Uncharacterized protein n=1 Tax=Trichuris suis TaxID=68888 RepID=A0A085LWF5_9BILA|nr:hypothetical protein M513_09853 [Trichuris suis]